MKRLIDFIVLSNLFISVAVGFFTWQSLAVFAPPSDDSYAFILINFIATFILYNLQRLFYSAKNDADQKYIWYINNRRFILTFMVLVLMLSANFLWNFFSNHLSALTAYTSLGVFSLFYFLPPLSLRKIGSLKPFFITLVFVFTGILLPFNFNLTDRMLGYMLAQAVFILALCILFDIRDMAYDVVQGIKTIPVIIGLKGTRVLVIALFHAYIGIMHFTQLPGLSLTALVIFCLGNMLTLFATPMRPNFYYGFLIDGLIILQGILVIWMVF